MAGRTFQIGINGVTGVNFQKAEPKSSELSVVSGDTINTLNNPKFDTGTEPSLAPQPDPLTM